MGWIPLPVGVENFEDLIQTGYYFVDKTLFIRELIDMKGKVNLFYPSPPFREDSEHEYAQVFL